MDIKIPQVTIEDIQRSQDDKWQFCVKLMYMLRCNEISVSDTNLDIYKRVIGAMAKDTIDDYEAKKKYYDELMSGRFG